MEILESSTDTTERFDLWQNGAHAIWLEGKGARVRTVAETRVDSLWVQRRQTEKN